MTLTFLLALIGLAALVIVFIAAYLTKGIKTALISTGIAAVIFALLYVGAIYVVASSMN